jgi:hypothetical protein
VPVRSDAQAATNKWVTNMQNAGPAMTAGANRVTQSPGALAAAAADKWLTRLQASKPKFIARAQAVTVDQWRTAYLNYGISRATQGAQQKSGKFLAFQQEWLGYLAANMAAIDRMPTTTLQDGINKAVAQITLNAKFKRGQSAA